MDEHRGNDDSADWQGMYYMSGAAPATPNTPQTFDIIDTWPHRFEALEELEEEAALGPNVETLGELLGDVDVLGLFGGLRRALTSPLRAVARLNPLRRGGGGGGGGGGGEGEAEGGDDKPAGEGESDMTQGLESALRGALDRKRGAHLQDFAGFSLRNLVSKGGGVARGPAGKLLVSTVPGGASAMQAHAIANKALKTGALKPAHLKAAGALAKRGRAGDDHALVKIAAIKQKAAKGDPHAAKALDTIKLAHCIQTGQKCAPSSGGKVRRLHSAGLATIHPRR